MKEEQPFEDPFSGVVIRQATHIDLYSLEWEGEYQHFRKVYEEAYQRMEKGLSILWIMDLPGTGVIGQAFVQYICGRPELADGHTRAYMYAFRIRPEYRSLGLGSMMLDFLEDFLKEKGYKSITLNVAKDNPRAQKLYQHHGYQIIAHEPGEWSYEDHEDKIRYVREPAWRMEKKLG